jgi:hypothetical protein
VRLGCDATMASSRCPVPRRPVNSHQLIAGGARCFEAGRPVQGHAASRRALLQRAAGMHDQQKCAEPAALGRTRSWRRRVRTTDEERCL